MINHFAVQGCWQSLQMTGATMTPCPTDTVSNALGTCSLVFIHITVGFPYHTIPSEPPKELAFYCLPFFQNSGLGVCVEGAVRTSTSRQGNGKLKSQNDKGLFADQAGGFSLTVWREPVGSHFLPSPSNHSWLSFPLFFFPPGYGQQNFQTLCIWCLVWDSAGS